jgi:hypothetical protein
MRALYVVLAGVALGSAGAGCSRTVGGGSADADGDSQAVFPYTQTLPDGPCAVEGVTGTLPGVTLAIRSSSCVYKRGTPATFTYEVTTTGVPPITLPQNTGGCSDCGVYTTDPLSFTRYSIGGDSAGGEHQQWCLCDQGCCFGTNGETVQVNDATTSFQIQWSGRVWFGPSDTGNQEEGFFLPGRYDVFVTFKGFDEGNVQATLPIEIVL